MPYYICRVERVGELPRAECLDWRPAYPEASALLRTLRAGSADPASLRMVFAASTLEAEDLLSQTRPSTPLVGDDY